MAQDNAALQKRKDLYDWLDRMIPSNIDERHRQLINERTPGTGTWFVDQTKTWLEADDKMVMWRRGIRKQLHTKYEQPI